MAGPDARSVRRVGPGDTSTGVRVGTVALCFAAVLLDGFDSASLSFVVPSLASSWQSAAATFTPALVGANLGVVVGYVLAGVLAARYRTRRVLIGGVVLFAVASMATALVLPTQSIAALSAMRVVTGLGLGIVLPSAVTTATNITSARRRQVVSVAVTLGLAGGAALAGLFGGLLLRSIGIAGVFWLGGLAPLLLAAVMLVALPRTDRTADTYGGHAEPRSAGVARMLAPGMRVTTVLLWVFAFLVFLASYTLQSWVPTLLTGYGFAATEAPIGLAFLSIGGIVGGLALLALASRIGIARALIVMPLVGFVAIVVAATAGVGHLGLLVMLGGAGAGLVAGQIGQLTLAVAVYDAQTRTTGVGWAAAAGRIGSIVGPGVAGVLLASALPGSRIVLLTSVPVLVAALCAAAMWRRSAQASPARPGPARSVA